MAKFILLMLRKPVNNGIRTIYLKKFILEWISRVNKNA
jgi:hypothetical protein